MEIRTFHAQTIDPQSRHPWRILSRGEPSRLFETLPACGFAVIGTRSPQHRSLELVRKSLEGLRGTGLVILSGFARGVDAAAHEAALDSGLNTLAIVGSGIDLDYPSGSIDLKQRIIAQGGMILSPFPDGTPPLRRNFTERNRLIALLSRAVWVVEGAAVSGTLNTASWASRMDRDLYATPAFPGDSFFSGNQKLLSHEVPDRHPLAHAFYGPGSLLGTWPDRIRSQGEFFRNPPAERWIRSVLQLESEWGECRLEQLREKVGCSSWSDFHNLLREEIQKGRLRIDPCGKVSLQGEEKS
jgi:DNA protecting protein DprA